MEGVLLKMAADIHHLKDFLAGELGYGCAAVGNTHD